MNASAASVSPHLEVVMLRTAFVSLGLLIPLVACGGDDPTGPESGPMTALIDGESFVAEFATVQGNGGQVYVNGAGASARAIGFTIPEGATGTYELEVGTAAAAGVQIGNASWIAGGGTGSGSITVTTFTETRIAGTFSFIVENSSGDTLQITEGTFDIAYGAG